MIPHFLILQLDPGRLAELRNAGYEPRVVDPADVTQKVVRVDKPTEDMIARIRAVGADLIQREPDYIVVQATERQLDVMKRQQVDYRLIQERDLTPRFVRTAARLPSWSGPGSTSSRSEKGSSLGGLSTLKSKHCADKASRWTSLRSDGAGSHRGAPIHQRGPARSQ